MDVGYTVGRSEMDRRVSEAQVHAEHSPPTVDRLSVHDADERAGGTTSCTSSASTSPDHWLSGYYSRHHSLQWPRTASAPPPPRLSAVDRYLHGLTALSAQIAPF